MRITSDWHIHTHNSCDCRGKMKVAELIQQAESKGITDFGITDHVHNTETIKDIQVSRQEFLANNPSPHIHFGAEVSCVSQWELDMFATGKYQIPTYGLRSGGPPSAAPAVPLTLEEKNKLGVEYVVGGAHWPLYVQLERSAIISDYHRQNMFLATHPVVNIVAHPWWWMGAWKGIDGFYTAEPWFDDFRVIPKGMHAEFAAAVKEHGKVVEINLDAMLLGHDYTQKFKMQYLEYLAGLKEQGVPLSIGSDCHEETYKIDFETAAAMLESVGIKDEELWRLPAKTNVGD